MQFKNMHVFKTLLFSIVLVINEVNNVYSDCSLSLNQDFGNPQPIFIQNGGLMAPKDNGSVLVSELDTLTVGCVGKDRFIVLGNDTNTSVVSVAEARCVSDNMFSVGSWTGLFRDITCNAPPWSTAEFSGIPCYSGNEIVRVGYKVRGTLYPLYEACFDRNFLSTTYVRHSVGPSSSCKQDGRRRPSFIDGGLFGNIKISELYRLENQKRRINAILGANMEAVFLSKKQFLTRGHLAPRADFPLRSAQRASFHYVNAAPQWMRGNAGDWAALEEGIRRRVDWYGRSVTVYTGTHAVSTLPNGEGVHMALYLDVDENNNPLLPVPLYFYKVIYDPKEKAAVAFVSINSSFFNKTMIEELTFCDDICEGNRKFNWLKWKSNDGTHSFCCSFQQFTENVPHLPHLDVKKLFF